MYSFRVSDNLTLTIFNHSDHPGHIDHPDRAYKLCINYRGIVIMPGS